MPQFLTTSGTAHLIEDIIIRAKTKLVLITPYLKLSRILFERLTEANQRGVKIQLVYGKSELHNAERKQLDALNNMELLYLENLHAKCYHNESTLLVSSMNLYEFSEKNNREMGIVLTRRDDEECFADALAEAQSIIMAAQTVTTTKRTTTVNPPTASAATASSPQREFDHHLKGRRVHELLRQNAPNAYTFKIRREPHAMGDGYTTVVSARDFPRRGIDFQFDGSIRFDFANSRDYQTLKETRRNYIDNILSDYRCYWNRDVIQIYAAKNYQFKQWQRITCKLSRKRLIHYNLRSCKLLFCTTASLLS
jgi:hypothetical protein